MLFINVAKIIDTKNKILIKQNFFKINLNENMKKNCKNKFYRKNLIKINENNNNISKNENNVDIEKESEKFNLKIQDIPQNETTFFEANKNFLNFFLEVKNEINMIEWPTFDKLFKQFVIVVMSLVLSALLIYSIDGFFAFLSQILFEGKI
jgi:preprotein translocase SecE subunit